MDVIAADGRLEPESAEEVSRPVRQDAGAERRHGYAVLAAAQFRKRKCSGDAVDVRIPVSGDKNVFRFFVGFHLHSPVVLIYDSPDRNANEKIVSSRLDFYFI